MDFSKQFDPYVSRGGEGHGIEFTDKTNARDDDDTENMVPTRLPANHGMAEDAKTTHDASLGKAEGSAGRKKAADAYARHRGATSSDFAKKLKVMGPHIGNEGVMDSLHEAKPYGTPNMN